MARTRDLAKRKRIMQRSMKLGHCICDPKQPCPCPALRERDICHCAGERPEPPTGEVRLTQLVPNPGCASKIDQESLKRILAGLPEIDHPQVLVGAAAADDAGVFRLDGSLALVQTVDVFCPSLDDPYQFGQVAAANSLSDVYAMGGRPVTALAVIGFPTDTVPERVMTDILRGGIDKMNEAGVPVIGGHSIRDPEIKAGFAVTGLVDPERMMTNAGVRPGDVLVLTKPLGTGIIAFASQIGRAPPGALDATAASMTALNKTAAELMVASGAHACTDVTGFGLIGHLSEMARLSGVDVEIVWDDLPLFPCVVDCVAEEIIPGGIERNRESSAGRVILGKGAHPAMLDVCLDPQTSGGLLIAMPAAEAEAFLDKLHEAGVADAAIVGTVRGKGTGRVFIETRGTRPIPVRAAPEPATGRSNDTVTTRARSASAEAARPAEVAREPDMNEEELECCPEEPEGAVTGAAGPATVKDRHRAFLAAVNQPGAVDVATKQAVNLALSIVTRCGPCTAMHLKKAREMGFSEDEIDELAMMAIAFGGSPVMMFLNEVRKQS